jgi:excisionase family DNA binding protein
MSAQVLTATQVPAADEFLTLSELCALLKIEPCTIYNSRRAATSDVIPSVRVGRFLRFRKSAVLEWFARQESVPISHRQFKPRKQRKKVSKAA